MGAVGEKREGGGRGDGVALWRGGGDGDLVLK